MPVTTSATVTVTRAVTATATATATEPATATATVTAPFSDGNRTGHRLQFSYGSLTSYAPGG